MSWTVEETETPATMDPYEIGWYIESADEETYGPVSRKAIRQFLEENAISPNTLVRHCTQPEARPVADQQGLIDHVPLEDTGAVLGDRLDEVWPRKKRARQALAEDSLPCARHGKKPAVLMCVRCHAPYCNKCRARPFRKQFFLCRRCQMGMYNRRTLALIIDTLLLVQIPTGLAMYVMFNYGFVGDPATFQLILIGLNLLAVVVMFGRDAWFGGSGIGKGLTGLRVVRTEDGQTPLTFGQGVVRWLSTFIPFFNLVDLGKPAKDPLLRRYGDIWAKTRVIDTEKKLEKARAKTRKRLLSKGIQPPPDLEMSMPELAQLA